MKKQRMIVNTAMTAVLLCLMAYSLIGETAHEILGTALFILFTVHHILNRRWFGALTRGRYGAFRVLQTGLVLLLILSVLCSMVSGILLSNKLYTFLPRIKGASVMARSVHLVCAYLNFILISLHLGLHWNAMLSGIRRRGSDDSKNRTWLLRLAGCSAAAYGVYAFVKRQIGEYLFLRTHFVFLDPSEPLVFFFLDYIAIMGLFVWIGHYLAKITKRMDNDRKDGPNKGKESLL